MHFVTFLLLGLCALPLTLVADGLTEFNELKDAGLLVQSRNGESLISMREEQAFIPASTTKLVTAWLALRHWGEEKRFITDFYFDERTHSLFIKGSGDPFLVSQELDHIASALQRNGLDRVDRVVLDNSAFVAYVKLPGIGGSHNPYDAIPTALAANFNTIYAKRNGQNIQSAEKQTPLTDFARSHSQLHDGEIFRINTGSNPRDAERYFGELLTSFLRDKGVQVKNEIQFAKTPYLDVYYRHYNSKTLAQIIRPMMKYSTNFIANQLVLMLSREHYSRPANANDVQNYMQSTLRETFNWRNFTLKEGAGLSRKNRLSPLQITDVLRSFLPWRHLLPEIEDNIFAKSGTLENVSTLAGYIVVDNDWQPFAIMMNQAVPYKLRNKIAKNLQKQL